MYGRLISSILLNIPGDEPTMMTCLFGYPMAQQGRAGEALSLSGIAFLWGLLCHFGAGAAGTAAGEDRAPVRPGGVLRAVHPAFATLGGISSSNQAKSAFAAVLGLGIAMIGVDTRTGVQRFTFGELHLYDGIDFLIAIVGLFALSEVFIFLERHKAGVQADLGGAMKIGRLMPSAAWWPRR